MDKYYEWIKETLKAENVDLDQINNSSDVGVLDHIQDAVRDLKNSLELIRQHIGLTEGNIYARAKVHTCAVHGEKLIISESEEEPTCIDTKSSKKSINENASKLEELPDYIKERHVSSKTKCLYLGLPYYFESDKSESPDTSDLEAINVQCDKLKSHYLELQQKKHTKKRVKTKPSTSSYPQTSTESSTLESTKRPRPKKIRKPPVPTECNEPKISEIEPDIEIEKVEPKKVEKETLKVKVDVDVQTEKEEVIDYKETYDHITNGRKLHKINNCIFLDPDPNINQSIADEKYLIEESFKVEEVTAEQPEKCEEAEKKIRVTKKRKTTKESGSQTTLKGKSKTVKFKDESKHESSNRADEKLERNLNTFPRTTKQVQTQNSSSQTEQLLSPAKNFPTNLPQTESMQQVTTSTAARIDLHIKVSSSSNVKVDGSTETEPQSEEQSKEQTEKSDENPECSKTTNDKNKMDNNPKLTIRVVSEDNLNVTSNDNLSDVKISRTSNENLNIEQQPNKYHHSDSRLDVDNISVNSMSEGDNSVFSDGQVSPSEEGACGGVTKQNVATAKCSVQQPQQEEVDDIELIFSSDENKDYGQEDLVSISEFEPWREPGATGTPVLTNFKKMSSFDRKSNKENIVKRQDSGAQTDKSCGDKSLESDSFSCEIRQENVTKSSSLEKDSSLEQDVITRDESFDTFEAVIPAATIQRRWTKASILVETDISKCGITEEITEEALLGLPRRNTCPNPAPYRPIIHTTTRQITTRSPLAVKFNRSPRTYASHFQAPKTCLRPKISETEVDDLHRCSSAVQTDISALPPQWRSESHLVNTEFDIGLYTLPSKYEAPRRFSGQNKCPLRLSDKTQEARRVMLSDINFTSMVPELSRSADHICPENELEDGEAIKAQGEYYKGVLLQTPDYSKGYGARVLKELTQSYSLTSPGISNWTVNEGSQTTQTGGYWDRGDSFDSSKSYSFNSKHSNLEKHHRSRSVPSVRCVVCRQAQTPTTNMRVSESMHYTTRNAHHENETPSKIRGSLPDLRHQCNCTRRYEGGHSLLKVHAESICSAESLIEEPEECLTGGSTQNVHHSTMYEELRPPSFPTIRRCSENDLERHFTPPHCSSPFLPKTPECLKYGNLAKVILKNGRVAVGRVRYIGKIKDTDDAMIGIQLPTYWGDTDGSLGDKRYFQCPPQHGTFLPFSKVVMAWNA